MVNKHQTNSCQTKQPAKIEWKICSIFFVYLFCKTSINDKCLHDPPINTNNYVSSNYVHLFILLQFVIANKTSIVGGSITRVAHQFQRDVGQRIRSPKCDQQSKFRDQCQLIGQLVERENAGMKHANCPQRSKKKTGEHCCQWHCEHIVKIRFLINNNLKLLMFVVVVVGFAEIPVDDTQEEEGDQ